jgi:hypothetical protein
MQDHGVPQLSAGVPKGGRQGGLEAIDQQIHRLQDAIEALAEDLAQVSRFDEPDSDVLTTVRDEPPSALRAFEVRLSDMTERLQRMRRQLDL